MGLWRFDHFLENIDRQHLERQLYTFNSKYNVEEALKNLEKINFVYLREYC